MNKVALLYGGSSLEREISITSGNDVGKALTALGINYQAIDWNKESIDILASGSFSQAIIVLHGGDGENGSVQAILESLEIPYTGSSTSACAFAMDKEISKLIWQNVGLPTLEFKSYLRESYLESQLLQDVKQYPLCVKAASLGSSFGVYCVHNQEELLHAVEEIFKIDSKMLVEPWIAGCDYTVAIVGDEIMPSLKIETAGNFYDYKAKYVDNTTKYLCPSGLSAKKEQEIAELAWEAYVALGCSGWGRVDFMCDEQQNFYLLEINTAPGMTSKSLVPKACAVRGISYQELVQRILAGAALKANSVAATASRAGSSHSGAGSSHSRESTCHSRESGNPHQNLNLDEEVS